MGGGAYHAVLSHEYGPPKNMVRHVAALFAIEKP